jgi:hypothetical protein
MFYRFYNTLLSAYGLVLVLSTAGLLFPMVNILFYHEDEDRVFL